MLKSRSDFNMHENIRGVISRTLHNLEGDCGEPRLNVQASRVKEATPNEPNHHDRRKTLAGTDSPGSDLKFRRSAEGLALSRGDRIPLPGGMRPSPPRPNRPVD